MVPPVALDLPVAQPLLAGNCVVVPVLNGVRHIDALSERFGRNHVFGGLTAVNAALMPNGEIVQSAVRVDMTVSSRALIDAVLDETFRVAAPEGYRPPDGIKDTARALYSQSDSTYGPSILVDMENGRTTEGEHTIGDLVDRANKHGVPVPILAAARTNLQVYEAGRIKA